MESQALLPLSVTMVRGNHRVGLRLYVVRVRVPLTALEHVTVEVFWVPHQVITRSRVVLETLKKIHVVHEHYSKS